MTLDQAQSQTLTDEVMNGAEISLYLDTAASTSCTSLAALPTCALSTLMPWCIIRDKLPCLPSRISCSAVAEPLRANHRVGVAQHLSYVLLHGPFLLHVKHHWLHALVVAQRFYVSYPYIIHCLIL